MDSKILLDEVTVTGEGGELIADETYAATMIFEVEGTFSNVTIEIKATYRSGGPKRTVPVTDIETRLQDTEITEAGVYMIDATGLYEVFPDVVSLSGGNVTVRAKQRVG